jgi:hypothetical protein
MKAKQSSKVMKLHHTLLAVLAALPTFAPHAHASTAVHTSWLWHLHQPVYWPDRRSYGTDHYENAWDTIQQQNGGRPHPAPEVLSTIFGWGDRVAAYQYQPKNTIQGLLGYANAGAQVSYSGALIENVQSLATAGQLGYGAGWNGNNQTARSWTTSGGKPRMDLVNFTYHHSLAPLLSDETLEMELRIQQRQMDIFWGTTPPGSKGFFPAETCFTERMIPILKKAGINWTVIANTHLARACADFPVVTGSGGEMCDLPNLADQLNPAQGAGNYQRISIDRGCSPIQAMPFGFQLHQARFVDPNTGTAQQIIVVPSDQVFGWKDSYSTWDLNLINNLAARNDPAKPSLVLCAHDGDNAWSGGSSYYNEWVPNMAGQAATKGYEPTTVEQFIAEFPPNSNDVVHVEDGGWVYADGDMGSPIFVNWHWPPGYLSSGAYVVDPSTGVSDKADNWRVIIATENRVKTAQQISGITPAIDQVRDPGSFSGTPNAVELGWHYYLGSLDSGFVYYGCHDDECQRAVVAQSNAVRNVNSIIAGNPAADTTPPTTFIPQRHPWNPGGTNFGVQYGYQVKVATNSDFWVWTYAYDASGITNVSLRFRVNGTNPPASDQFKTYAGGPLAGAWQTSNMTHRVVAPVIGVTPQYIADYYYSKVTGVSNTFVDYYVSAADAHGNTFNSPIQHVWVGAGSGGGGSGGGPVTTQPSPPVVGSSVTIQYNATGRILSSANPVYIHLGWNNWGTVIAPDPVMTFNVASNAWQFTTNVPANTTQLDAVFNNGSGTWDNNSGADWHFAVVTNGTPQPPATPTGLTATPASTNQINLGWSAAAYATGYIINRSGSPVGTTAGTTFNDTGLATGAAYCYTVAATNGIGISVASAAVCTNTLSAAPTNFPAFNMDGAVDFAGYQVSSNGLTLFAALRGTQLYIATASPGTTGPSDHFIFVTDQLLPGATGGAPWAKTGFLAVTNSKPFLATESQNSYVAWNNAPVSSLSAKSATTSGVLEGVIDLTAAFGAVPANIYLCAAAYATADGGTLANQSPAGSGGNIEPGEFFVIPTTALRDHNSDGTFDRMDPLLDFVLQGIAATGTNVVMTWAAMPGRSYQVMGASAPGGSWTDIPGSLTNAGPLQLDLGFGEPLAPGATQRLYRIKLLP